MLSCRYKDVTLETFRLSRGISGARSRRELLWLAGRCAVALAAAPCLAGIASRDEVHADEQALIMRPIPRTGERLPVVGLGTSQVFEVGNDGAERAPLVQVLRTLVFGGGKIIDTASTYGNAERVVGELLEQTGLRPRVFIATKLESYELTTQAVQGSLQRLHTSKIDLMQYHNVVDPNTSLAPLRAWQQQGLCRYIGITSTNHADFDAVEAIVRREKPDFVQIDYALDDRLAEQRIIPTCADLGVAILVALPLGHGRLLRAVRNQPLPPWAADFGATTWAQFFLKFVLGNPAITAVIPGTANPSHMADNLGAGRGKLPTAAQRKLMVQWSESIG
jgi:aryl-alcohol dehydrogenase-like predicted oxidoreductase